MDKILALLVLLFWGASCEKSEIIPIEEGKTYRIAIDSGCEATGARDIEKFDDMASKVCSGSYGYRNVRSDGCSANAILICIDQPPAELPPLECMEGR